MKTLTAFGRTYIVLRPVPCGFECAWADQPARRELIRFADVAENLGESARGVLTDTAYRSFCIGSDELVAKGLWTENGERTPLGDAVRQYINLHTRY